MTTICLCVGGLHEGVDSLIVVLRRQVVSAVGDFAEELDGDIDVVYAVRKNKPGC